MRAVVVLAVGVCSAALAIGVLRQHAVAHGGAALEG